MVRSVTCWGWMCALGTIAILGCRGERGAVGPQGPQGDQGLPGNDLTDPAGTPDVQALADDTGGRLVVGDLLTLTGAALDTVDIVLVGDVPAPILSQAAVNLQIQIPAGVAPGLNEVHLINLDGDTGLTESVAAVQVHRLAVFIGSTNDKVAVVDTFDHTILGTFDSSSDAVNFPIEIGFANNGSLAIVPTGTNNVVTIDLTANPPAFANLALGGTQYLGVAVSPDDLVAVLVDHDGISAETLNIDESMPPYTNPVSAGMQMALAGEPRWPTFIGPSKVVTSLDLTDELAILDWDGTTLGDSATRITAAEYPLQTIFLPDQGRLFSLSFYGNAVETFLAGGAGVVATGATATLSAQPLQMGLSPNAEVAYVTDIGGVGGVDALSVVHLGDAANTLLDTVVPTSGMTLYTALGVEPVYGRFVYLSGVGGDSVEFYDVLNAGTIVQRATVDNPLAGETDLDGSVGLGFQP